MFDSDFALWFEEGDGLFEDVVDYGDAWDIFFNHFKKKGEIRGV